MYVEYVLNIPKILKISEVKNLFEGLCDTTEKRGLKFVAMGNT